MKLTATDPKTKWKNPSNPTTPTVSIILPRQPHTHLSPFPSYIRIVFVEKNRSNLHQLPWAAPICCHVFDFGGSPSSLCDMVII